jgi:predicted small secreted protein
MLSCSTHHWELVHGHLRKVATVLGLVCDQACSSDHVGGHAVSNVEENVLSLADFRKILDIPVCSLSCTVVAKNSFILARLEECYTAVGFGSDIDERGSVGVLSKEVLVPDKC